MTSSAVGGARRLVGGEHLVEELVAHAALDELVLGEHAVLVLVHLDEYLLGASVLLDVIPAPTIE